MKYIIESEQLFMMRACMRLHLEDLIGMYHKADNEESKLFIKNTISDINKVLNTKLEEVN